MENKINNETNTNQSQTEEKCVAQMEAESQAELLEEPMKKLIKKCKEFLLDYGSPIDIVKYLDRSVVKQTEAKWMAAELLYERAKSLAMLRYIEPSRVLMMGPTGSGKTFIWKELSKISPLPIAILDSSQMTSNGFKGKNRDQFFMESRLAGDMIEYGFIILDEFDKMCTPKSTSHGENVSAEIQSEMLKIFEGTLICPTLGQEENPPSLNTEFTTIVCAGAFDDIFAKTVKRKSNPLGFGSVAEEEPEINITEELVNFGMIRELAGRFSQIVALEPLAEKDYVKIIEKSSNGPMIDLKFRFMSVYGIKVGLGEGTAEALAQLAFKKKTGARGIITILEKACRNLLPEILEINDIEMIIMPEHLENSEKRLADMWSNFHDRDSEEERCIW